jgi:hypothetical protein
MPLSVAERLTMLLPPSLFYRQRSARESRTGEPELAVLAELVPHEAFIIQRGEKIAALPAITALGKNTNWGTDIETRKVLFVPR